MSLELLCCMHVWSGLLCITLSANKLQSWKWLCMWRSGGVDGMLPRQQKEHVESISSYGFAILYIIYIILYIIYIIFYIQSCLPMCFSCSTNPLVNIPFSLPRQSSPVVLYPISSHVVCRRDSNDTASGAFRQDLSNHAKMLPLGQSRNVVIYKCAYAKHHSQSGGCEFDLPYLLFLSAWSHFTRQACSSTLWVATCMISLTTVCWLAVMY